MSQGTIVTATATIEVPEPLGNPPRNTLVTVRLPNGFEWQRWYDGEGRAGGVSKEHPQEIEQVRVLLVEALEQVEGHLVLLNSHLAASNNTDAVADGGAPVADINDPVPVTI